MPWRPSEPTPGLTLAEAMFRRRDSDSEQCGRSPSDRDVAQGAVDLVRAKRSPLIVILAEANVILPSHSVQTQ